MTTPTMVRSRHMAEVAELVRAAADGDQAAWHGLVDRYNGLVWSVARAHRLSTVDASDVVQTTWLRLVEHLGRLQDPERVGAWLATTARRECLRTLRHSARLVPTEEVPEVVAETRVDAASAGRGTRPRCCGGPSAGSPSAARPCCGSWSPIPRRATRRSGRRWTCRSAASARPAQRCLERLRGAGRGRGRLRHRPEGGSPMSDTEASAARTVLATSTRCRSAWTRPPATPSRGARSTRSWPSSPATPPTRRRACWSAARAVRASCRSSRRASRSSSRWSRRASANAASRASSFPRARRPSASSAPARADCPSRPTTSAASCSRACAPASVRLHVLARRRADRAALDDDLGGARRP